MGFRFSNYLQMNLAQGVKVADRVLWYPPEKITYREGESNEYYGHSYK